MNDKTVISVKVDRRVRDRARRVAKKIGVPLSLVVNSGLRQFAQEERLMIQTNEAYRMSKKLERKLGKVEADIKAGRNLSAPFADANQALRWLRDA